MNLADRLVELLEEFQLNTIFGIPGEQILPFYKALANSNLNHILVRHEQAAAHACDGYFKSSGKPAVCVATAGPGALNLVMAVSTAFKDNIPMLILTGDNPIASKKTDEFQSFPLKKIFKTCTVKSFNPHTAEEAVDNFARAMYLINRGPVHINLSKDILLNEINKKPLKNYDNHFFYNYNKIQKFINKSERPLIILGSGALESKEEIREITEKYQIPVATTYPAKGLVDENEKHSLGLIGNRGLERSKYAFENCDCIIALGTRLSERTIKNTDEVKDKLIHVNIDNNCLKGKFRVHGPVKEFINHINFNNSSNWLSDILKIKDSKYTDGIDDESEPLRPQSAINTIYEVFGNNRIVNDAGSHTTWATILKKSDDFGKLLFSGGFAPMGYGLPAAVGSAIAKPQEKIILINGDGDFQMNMQELATVAENNLNILMVILNNSQYGVIKQTQRNVYNMDPFEVDLTNPDFIKIASAYGIDSARVTSKAELKDVLDSVKDSSKPFLLEVVVRQEDIPLPKD